MLTEICQELRNWFDRDQKKWHGEFQIQDGLLTNAGDILKEGQYYRIVGSLLNDGVHKYTGTADDELMDESFSGSVWSMAIPPTVVKLSQDIDDWMGKYGGIDSQAMSPYTSESFGGYSYSKNSGGSSADGSSGGGSDWRTVFASRLNRWRKI